MYVRSYIYYTHISQYHSISFLMFFKVVFYDYQDYTCLIKIQNLFEKKKKFK